MSNTPLTIWFIPKGKMTIFSARRAEIIVTEKKVSVTVKGEEVFATDPAQAEARASFGQVRFKKLDGQKNFMMSGPYIYLYNPALLLLTYLVAFFKIGKARQLAASINSMGSG
jgi:hypothetical protein